uniref:Right handed beta helix domain-containing protein n=1 Tax=Guillardia theta TaxID=55529 RepID=A0A7S4KLX1_GUITH|mmetsp:Transcript_26823/g.87810  ORF Transcript_26823/g.87810 Transcript_26823/m.87810 type:complete len:538 (+) Transcript_26823:1-1614(+)
MRLIDRRSDMLRVRRCRVGMYKYSLFFVFVLFFTILKAQTSSLDAPLHFRSNSPPRNLHRNLPHPVEPRWLRLRGGFEDIEDVGMGHMNPGHLKQPPPGLDDEDDDEAEMLSESEALAQIRDANEEEKDLGNEVDPSDELEPQTRTVERYRNSTNEYEEVQVPVKPKRGIWTCTPQELQQLDPQTYECVESLLGKPNDIDNEIDEYHLTDVFEEARIHQLELQKLQESDPNFYEYLQKDDRGKSLLRFGLSLDSTSDLKIIQRYAQPNFSVPSDYDNLIEAIDSMKSSQSLRISENSSWEGPMLVEKDDVMISCNRDVELHGRWNLVEHSSGVFATVICKHKTDISSSSTFEIHGEKWFFKACAVRCGGGRAAITCTNGAKLSLQGCKVGGENDKTRPTIGLNCIGRSLCDIQYCSFEYCGIPGSESDSVEREHRCGGIVMSGDCQLECKKTNMKRNLIGVYLCDKNVVKASFSRCMFIKNDKCLYWQKKEQEAPDTISVSVENCKFDKEIWTGGRKPQSAVEKGNRIMGEETDMAD